MKTAFLTIAGLLLAGAFCASTLFAAEREKGNEPSATKATDGRLSTQDMHFIRGAAQGGMLEVQLGELAKNKATRQDVKEFGGMMVTDHSKANDELKALAQAKGVTLDDQLDNKHSAMLEKLSRVDANEFDKAYIDDMVADHRKDAAEFEEVAKATKDSELKAFALKTGGVISTHLERITAIQKGQK